VTKYEDTIGVATALYIVIGATLTAQSNVRIIRAEEFNSSATQPSVEAERVIANGP